ncbi:MAG TPA: hypothetical protein VLQ45_26230 [Thermoanaerobaculia bacterium]|nr:hypothetical protein [Thermoanaerobaculia bacterium]
MLRTFRRPLALLVFVLLAGAGTAQALPAVEGPQEITVQNPLVLVWDWIASLFDKNSSFIDPNGGSLNPNPDERTSTTTATDNGSFIDPNGNS